MRYLWLLGMLLGFAGSLGAETIDVSHLGTVDLEARPRQVVTSADGQRIYVLTEAGKVLLYSADGQAQGSIEVGPEVASITPQGPNRLILQMAERQQMTMIALEPVVNISQGGAPILGKPEAPVAITVFDDFECPYCAQTVALLKQAQGAYPEQVKLVFKHFPLPMHKNARTAAIASLAAQRQGKFWPLHDLLFENYQHLNPQKIRELAEQVGLDMERFDQDRQDLSLQQQIETDLQEGLRLGVQGTPTVFINGRLLQQRSMAALSELIERELARLPEAAKEVQ